MENKLKINLPKVDLLLIFCILPQAVFYLPLLQRYFMFLLRNHLLEPRDYAKGYLHALEVYKGNIATVIAEETLRAFNTVLLR